jgi:hypothetical protein
VVPKSGLNVVAKEKIDFEGNASSWGPYYFFFFYCGSKSLCQ